MGHQRITKQREAHVCGHFLWENFLLTVDRGMPMKKICRLSAEANFLFLDVAFIDEVQLSRGSAASVSRRGRQSSLSSNVFFFCLFMLKLSFSTFFSLSLSPSLSLSLLYTFFITICLPNITH